MDASDLHFLVDDGGADIQRAAEDEREAKNVVHLVRIIRPPRGDQRVRRRVARDVRHDFRDRVGEAKDDRRLRHRFDHVAGQHAGGGNAEEHVSALHRIGKRAGVGFIGENGLVRRQVVSLGVNDALAVANKDVFLLHAEANKQLDAGRARRAAAGNRQTDILKLLA